MMLVGSPPNNGSHPNNKTISENAYVVTSLILSHIVGGPNSRTASLDNNNNNNNNNKNDNDSSKETNEHEILATAFWLSGNSCLIIHPLLNRITIFISGALLMEYFRTILGLLHVPNWHQDKSCMLLDLWKYIYLSILPNFSQYLVYYTIL